MCLGFHPRHSPRWAVINFGRNLFFILFSNQWRNPLEQLFAFLRTCRVQIRSLFPGQFGPKMQRAWNFTQLMMNSIIWRFHFCSSFENLLWCSLIKLGPIRCFVKSYSECSKIETQEVLAQKSGFGSSLRLSSLFGTEFCHLKTSAQRQICLEFWRTLRY